jgi:hypothetical protein
MIFGPKREEDGSWRKLHNDELHGLYSSPNVVRVIKSRKMKIMRSMSLRKKYDFDFVSKPTIASIYM